MRQFCKLFKGLGKNAFPCFYLSQRRRGAGKPTLHFSRKIDKSSGQADIPGFSFFHNQEHPPET
ncbi:MAG: hypothetical protein B6245_02425 [Desulfobacteraceae bacterium 4572_88]|nr:MAG: hypothetical protein B6245_02425 [Desulfobacteraceae bacterium 4572_88]